MVEEEGEGYYYSDEVVEGLFCWTTGTKIPASVIYTLSYALTG